MTEMWSPLEKDLVASSVSEAGSPHPQVLHQAQILDLVPDQHLIEPTWGGEGERGHIGLLDQRIQRKPVNAKEQE